MKENNSINSRILKVLKTRPGRAFRQRELADRLKIPQSNMDALKAALRKLMADEAVVRIKHGLYRLPDRTQYIEGKLLVNQKGFGFVLTDNDQPDIFIGRRQMSNAVNGDIVKVSIQGGDFKSPRGTVKRVLSRGTDCFVGTVYRAERSYWLAVQPLTPQRGIRIISTQSIDFEAGQSVVATVKDWGGSGSPIIVAVSKIIGSAGDPNIDMNIVLNRYGYDTTFPSTVLAEARLITEEMVATEAEDRIDYRAVKTFTIDPASARDFDDALSIESLESGYRLGVHIADVSHFVKVGSALDREALTRGTSVYFTEGVVHMLPPSLSANLCSLKPGCDRLALSALIEMDDSFNIIGFKVAPTIINSNYRFTYNQVQDILDGRANHTAQDELKNLLIISRRLIELRTRQGSIDFDIPEPIFILSPEGIPHTITSSERLDSHRIVEECMLLANRLVAEEVPGIEPKKPPFIYRVHDKPDQIAIQNLLGLLRLLKIYNQSGSGNLSSTDLRDILASVANSPYKNLVENITLRTMTKAIYSSVNRGHFGLAFKHYTHFTSPIRRYPDLLVHRLIKQYLGFGDSYTEDNLDASIKSVANQSTEAELTALQAEREYIRIKQLRWLKQHLGETFSGMISGVIQFGFFVELADTLVEGLVHIDTLTGDDFNYDPDHYRLYSHQLDQVYQLGDPVNIVVQDVLLDKQRANFLLTD